MRPNGRDVSYSVDSDKECCSCLTALWRYVNFVLLLLLLLRSFAGDRSVRSNCRISSGYQRALDPMDSRNRNHRLYVTCPAVICLFWCCPYGHICTVWFLFGQWSGSMVRTSVFGQRTLTVLWPIYGLQVTTLWINYPLLVSPPSVWGW